MTFPMLAILTDEGKALFPRLAAFKDDFYLAGGTALALQIGHRISVDFDLFSPRPIKKTLMAAIEEKLGEASAPLVATSRELSVMVHNVKCTFLHYPFETLLPFVDLGPVNALSAREILVTKAYTIGRRESLKDYIDLYTGLTRNVITLEDILDLANRKYGDAFNDRLFLEQLLLVDDAPEEAILMHGHPLPIRKDMTAFFSTQIQRLAL